MAVATVAEVPGDAELEREAGRELRDLDARAYFWIDVAVAKVHGTSADDVDWTVLDWPRLRDEAEAWLETLDPDTVDPSTPDAVLPFEVPGRDDVKLLLRARPRWPELRGYKRQRSLALATAPPETPPLQFADGASESLYALPIETVRDLAAGRRRLAIELPSHHETWDMLRGQMEHFGQANTSEMEPLVLEPYASMLGLADAPPGDPGDFDEGWRAIHGVEFPIVDDPRRGAEPEEPE
jgi:hypothetical protein